MVEQLSYKGKELSPRMDAQIKKYAKRLAFKIDPSLEQDFLQDMYVLWLEFDLANEGLLWTAIKHEMSDIVFRSRKYRYSVSNLKFISYEWLMIEMNEGLGRESHKRMNDAIKKILDLQLGYNTKLDNTLLIPQLLRKLSDREKQCIILCYYQGLNGKEAGKKMNISQSMISRYKNRALKKMRRMLSE